MSMGGGCPGVCVSGGVFWGAQGVCQGGPMSGCVCWGGVWGCVKVVCMSRGCAL